ncbi:LLM class flavin-dependent oxidoreductase [Dictyobacter arantiisoli]|uniref:LLM class F420-dependent oxidoreductase n=1 Tax=Dictyobacter arantiisoli TaxID=2014874 RepID=A0A5A5TGY2_9CHLR|nr:LLM class flavin-dependent oxidoreductase [Dictyobacter arantiisoli]GCF10627.1 LLM class F420-dependent oxidoreductase [Dictyobacter arantiisoli]
MQTNTSIYTAEVADQLPVRERVGLVLNDSNAATLTKKAVAAEEAGVRQIWSTQSPLTGDTLTAFAAVAIQTKSIRLGSSIIPTYPRHPLTMAGQALALDDLAPGRLRLGIGSSHRPIIEGVYGIPMVKPLDHLREYINIVRAALWEGQVDHQGTYFTVKAKLERTAKIPILTSALGENAFRLAGEISDGALPWLCPTPYLLKTSLPILQASARAHGRPVPPLVAHVLVAVNEDRPAVIEATRKQISYYGHLPFYAHMFAESGFPVGEGGVMSDDLISSLVISGTDSAIADRFKELLASGLNELLILPIAVQQADSELQHLMRLIGQL